MRLVWLAVWLGCTGDDALPEAVDADGDGVTDLDGDCDDGDPTIYPGNRDDVAHDGVDSDCDGGDEYDWDDDGYRYDEGDCNDYDPTMNPDGVEVCNHEDDDCDGEADDGVGEAVFRDEDHDGYGTGEALGVMCDLPPGNADNADDCDDFDVEQHPEAEELCNGEDDDCDGQTDEGC